MKNLIFALSLMGILVIPAFAQINETDLTAKKEIKNLGFMVGDWEGSGWMLGKDGQKHNFDQTEKVQFKLDSTIILVEGMGKSGGKVIHDALAIIKFNKDEKSYSFNSQLANGRGGTFKGELNDEKFYWYPNENMRYIISINEKGQWFEIGEMNRNGNWFQFFEMSLDRK